MTPDKDLGMWTSMVAVVGGVVSNIDVGLRTILLSAAAALVGILIGLGYNSIVTAIMDTKTEFRAGIHELKADTCASVDKLDNRMRGLETGQAEVKTLVTQHLFESRGGEVNKQVK